MAIATYPSDSAPPSISIENAGLHYAGRALFEGLDVRIEGGRFTCLLGPSGVGKSSLLRLIAGLEPRASETVVRLGSNGNSRRDVAYMAQTDLLLPWLTVIENVTLGARLRGERADTERARALLDRVGLLDRADDRPRALSGGMRQRVALARTLMENRPIVLMDEPFAALDAITRGRLQALAAELLVGRTVVLVTHDPLEALRLAHRIHVMAGRPAHLGEALEVPGMPPRDPVATAHLGLYETLLHRLTAADTAQ
ncbi:MAG: ABC transporter ATP-binding protein [Rhodospirillaceae bacterium]|nr:ABC transporter ATP-binding protein [Rhodospirillaceae bacterium]